MNISSDSVRSQKRAMTQIHLVTFSWVRTMVFVALFSAMGCSSLPKFGMESPGRPAVTWHSDDSGRPADTRSVQGSADLPESKRPESDALRQADTLFALAVDRRQQGDIAEAAQLYRQVLEIREREEGPNHPDVAIVLNNLGGLEAVQGHYDAAQPLIERALAIRQTSLGEEHVLTAESLSNLALLYAAQGKATAAGSLYRRALAILEKKSGTERAPLDTLLDNYAALLHDTGRDAQAEDLEARARLVRATAEREPDTRR